MNQSRTVKIALGQIRPFQGEPQKNLRKMLDWIDKASEEKADMICFPELSYTGYYLKPEEQIRLAETVEGTFVKALREKARAKGIHVIAGYGEAEAIPGKIYNSCIFIDDTGKAIGNMRKVYLWGKEKQKFCCGNEFPVFETKLGKIGLLLCYDMEFPEPSRIEALKGADMIVCPAAWSKGAFYRWNVDLAANALFNLLFVAGVNFVDENCCGLSKLVGPDGVTLAEASKEEEQLLLCEVDLNEVIRVRSRIPYYMDFREDTFSIDAVRKF